VEPRPSPVRLPGRVVMPEDLLESAVGDLLGRGAGEQRVGLVVAPRLLVEERELAERDRIVPARRLLQRVHRLVGLPLAQEAERQARDGLDAPRDELSRAAKRSARLLDPAGIEEPRAELDEILSRPIRVPL